MTSLRAALYARVSSEQQPTDSTINSQIAALEARLAQDCLSLMPDERFCDEGYSGATLVRPALERLRDAVAAGHLDRIYGRGSESALFGLHKACENGRPL